MRNFYLVVSVSLVVAACSDQGPTSPLEAPSTVRMSHVGSSSGDSTVGDLCGGLSPCDAFDYDRDGDGTPDGITGVPGMCFLPPTVNNHLSDPACSGDFVPGLSGMFELAWCQVQYPVVNGALDGSQPPTIVACQDPADWEPLVQDPSGGEFYSASVQWKRNEAADSTVFRLYVVRGDLHWAHRDVIVDPSLTTPADNFVLAIGHGAEPVKVRITKSLTCVYYDTQANSPENAATCLINGATTFPISSDHVATTFSFPASTPTFVADFEVSECLSLRDPDGNSLVDIPLASCKISVNAPIETLPEPAQIWVDVDDPRWITGPFQNARPNVLQVDEFGVRALPPHDPLPWFVTPTASNPVMRWIDRGLDKLASLFLPQPLYAFPGIGFDFKSMSDFMVGVATRASADAIMSGTACSSGEPSCLDLGSFEDGATVPVTVHVDAPDNTIAGTSFDVPFTRVHVFPETGSVACPASPIDTDQQCYAAGVSDVSVSPPNVWTNPQRLVIITGSTGRATFDWALAGGANRVQVASCGTAVPGTEPNPPDEPGADGVWGDAGDCSNRYTAMMDASAYDNGPADGFTPFEPVDTEHEVAIYAPPLTFVASTCPQIVVDGQKGDDYGTSEWEACATKTGFIAPLKGPKSATDNAWLYTYSDETTLYVALEVATNDLGNRIFINFAEQANGTQDAAGDELLVIDFGDATVSHDWHYTQACVGNNSSSLCGDPDAYGDGAESVQAAATVGGAGVSHDHVFYEFSRPLDSPHNGTQGPPKEDLHGVSGQQLGLLLHVTQGQGGGKGGFEYPDPQTSPAKYHPFTLQ